MKKAIYRQTGAAHDVLEIVDAPCPMPAPGEVRVRMAWSGVNPADTKARRGLRSKHMPFPEVTPHSDGAGIIDAVGDGVDPVRVGERVWIWNAAWGRAQGTAADFIVLPQAQAVALPDAVAMDAGACLGIPAMTAAHAVLGYGGVRGRRVLVAGGAGAVGHYAIQMARLAGASQVVATVSTGQKADIARKAGAEDALDYRAADFAERALGLTQGEGFDRVIEVDLAANARRDFDLLAPGGLLVAYGSSEPEASVAFAPGILKNLQLAFFIVYNLAPDCRRLAQSQLIQWLALGRLQHRIAARMALQQIADAHLLVESGQAIGNVVLSTGGRA